MRSVAKTAAASVEAITAPSRNDSSQESEKSACAPTPAISGRHEDADGAQERGGDDDFAQPPPRGLQAALVEDQAEADRSDALRQLRVVEADAARPVRAEQHPDAEKRDEHGKSRACGTERGDDARTEHDSDEQEDQAFVHAPILGAAC